MPRALPVPRIRRTDVGRPHCMCSPDCPAAWFRKGDDGPRHGISYRKVPKAPSGCAEGLKCPNHQVFHVFRCIWPPRRTNSREFKRNRCVYPLLRTRKPFRASYFPMQEVLIVDYQIVGYFAVQHRYKSGIRKVVRFPKYRINERCSIIQFCHALKLQYICVL